MWRWRLFQNRWWIVVASVMGLMVGTGSINLFAAGVFLKPVAAALGFGRGEVATALGIANLTSALATPFMGRFIDQYGSRRMMLPFIVLFALATASLSLLQAVGGHPVRALWHLGLRRRRAEPHRLRPAGVELV